jgi:hypothetical protein
VSCAAEAPAKFAAVNIPCAGSPVTTSKLTVGNMLEFFAHRSNCVQDPPRLMLWLPFSHVSVSSMKSAEASRDWGCGEALALVSV